MPISVFIEGEPKAQPRARAFSRKTATSIITRMYDPGTADGWKGCVMRALAPWANRELSGPVRIDLTFFFPRPKYMLTKKFPEHEVWHTKKPDRDNCEKAVLDAMKDIKVLADDCVVCDGRLRKFIVRKNGGRIGAYLRLTALPEIEAFQTVAIEDINREDDPREDERAYRTGDRIEDYCPGCRCLVCEC